MDAEVAIALALALMPTADPPPRVIPPIVRPVKVAPKALPCGDPDCQCGCFISGECGCAKQKAKAAEIIKLPATITVKTIQTTYRQPIGSHTHTCANGHTWDHAANPGHVCNALVLRNGRIEACGLAQYVQDGPRRLVTVTKAVDVVKTAPNVPTAAVGVPKSTPAAISYGNMAFPSAIFSGGCANGQCSIYSRR